MALWVILISCLARITSLPRTQAIASFRFRSASLPNPPTPAQLARAIDSVLGIDLFVFRRRCWKRAIVLHRYLALTGIESQIKFGLRKNPDGTGTVLGHAWVEHQDRPVLEDDTGDPYTVTFSLPRRSMRAGVDLRPHHDRELCLLVECGRASVDAESAGRIRDLASAGLNWNRLLKLAHRHHLAPLLFLNLSRLAVPGAPADALASLRDYFQKNSAFSLLFTGELVRLLARLSGRGIDAIPYKGPAMAMKLYGHVVSRQFCDLDILVRECDVWHASRVIEELGFVSDAMVSDKKRTVFLQHTYTRVFSRDAGRTLVELHWKIAEPYFGVQFDAASLWPRRELMPLRGTTVSKPGAEDLLVMLCVHGGRHGWDKLEGVCSVAALLQQTPAFDWDYAWQRSREMRCQRMLTFGLLLADGLFHIPLPAAAAAMVRSPSLLASSKAVVRAFSSEEAPPRAFANELALHLRLKDSYADRMRHCVRLVLTPSPADFSTVRLPESLPFLYRFVRPIRLARKLGSRLAAA